MPSFIKPATNPPLQYRGPQEFVMGYGVGTPDPRSGTFEVFEMEVLAADYFAASECVERYLMGAAND